MKKTGITLGSLLSAPALLSACSDKNNPPINSNSWKSVRVQFNMNHEHIQMSQMLLASHPTPVRDAIKMHRDAFDKSPAVYWEEKWLEQEIVVTKAAANYINSAPEEIALTDSTTQGISLVLNGFKLNPGDEIVTTTHDHYVTEMSLAYSSQKNGATIKRIDEYVDPSVVTIDEVVTNITDAITAKTKLVVVTWVQSCTGVKLPIREIANAISELNKTRDSRIYFFVDGVHGFGNQDVDIPALGCDFFSAGTHKWIFGPRGTGIIWGRKNAWDMVSPTIPAFRMDPFTEWLGLPVEEITFGDLMSPGGFHAYDHRWALDAAFNFQLELGRNKVHQRTTAMSTALKDGIRKMSHVKLITPVNPDLSAGINCFKIDGLSAEDAVARFHEKKVIASSSPYKVSYARLTPCIINTDEEVEQCLAVLSDLNT